jgi:hypothetical protein
LGQKPGRLRSPWRFRRHNWRACSLTLAATARQSRPSKLQGFS